ncbi:MAG TPA: tyrosine-protein phosphatase [Candidatus Gastranaerophilaceae bacterium]|nr:tyrosine-protein phosphatase [Candidatus Gastranaerophilaceae bacterium]HPT41187.1 tyrosine-protein phosphatase [Candidatus Gastranaerophilaceae bacterium]
MKIIPIIQQYNLQKTRNKYIDVNFQSSKFYNHKICLPKTGICNFKQWDENLYSGSQPGKRGDFGDIYFLDTNSLKNDLNILKQTGIDKIIDLRRETTDGICVSAEREKTKKMAMEYKNIPMSAKNIPTHEQIKEFFNELKTAKGRVFLHCKEGYDRTGMMLCIYLAHITGDKPNKIVNKVFEQRNLIPFRYLNDVNKQKMLSLMSYISSMNKRDFEYFLKTR